MDAAPDIAKELFKVYTDSMAKTLKALFLYIPGTTHSVRCYQICGSTSRCIGSGTIGE
jgi:hypothetical protein